MVNARDPSVEALGGDMKDLKCIVHTLIWAVLETQSPNSKDEFLYHIGLLHE